MQYFSFSVSSATILAEEVAKLTAGVAGVSVDVVVYPPHPFLFPVNSKISSSGVKVRSFCLY